MTVEDTGSLVSREWHGDITKWVKDGEPNSRKSGKAIWHERHGKLKLRRRQCELTGRHPTLLAGAAIAQIWLVLDNCGIIVSYLHHDTQFAAAVKTVKLEMCPKPPSDASTGSALGDRE